MSQSPGFTLSPSNITGIAEAIAGIIVAVVAFVHHSSPVVDTAGIFAALHGIGHGLKAH